MPGRNIAVLCALALALSCSRDATAVYDDSRLDIAPFYGIVEYGGPFAGDAAADSVDMQDEDTFWEAVGFRDHVVVTWSAGGADVQGAPWVGRRMDGGDVVLDIGESKKTEIVLRGSSGDGSLKVYGAKKFKLTLSGLDLRSSTGAAVNIQCPKRVFVHLTDGTVNRLVDAPSYVRREGEDMKACFFAEGDIIFSGTGALLVEGTGGNAIASDDGIVFRPGVTVVSVASSSAGKSVKAKECIEMKGGLLDLSTSGDAYYDEASMDDKSSVCMSSDSTIFLRGGVLSASSTGIAGKGIKAAGSIFIGEDGTAGPDITVSTSGGKFEGTGYSSSPKGIKALGRIEVRSGRVTIPSCAHEGMESKDPDVASIRISGGELNLKSFDDCINTAGGVLIEGGNVFVCSTGNDGIDANYHGEGSFDLEGGYVIALTSYVKHDAGVDTDKSPMKIAGGTLFTCGRPQRGITSAPNGKSATQPVVMLEGIDLGENDLVEVSDGNGKTLFSFRMHFPFPESNSLFTCPQFTLKGTYTIRYGSSEQSVTFTGNYIRQ